MPRRFGHPYKFIERYIDQLIGVSDLSVSTFEVLSEGSTTARRLATRFAEVKNVLDYGAVGNGSADDTTAIQAAIDAAESDGGGVVLFPPGDYLISATLIVDDFGVMLEGMGSGETHDVGGQISTTRIIWGGSAGGTMVKFTSPIGASAQKKGGGGMTSICLWGLNTAGIGLLLESWRFGAFSSLFLVEFTNKALSCTVVTTLGEARDTQVNTFSQISTRIFNSGGVGIHLDGVVAPAANTSMNLFSNIDCYHKDGDGFVFAGCDANLVQRIRVYRAAGGSGSGIVFEAGSVSGDEARANILVHVSGNTGAVAQGTESDTVPSHDNTILLLDDDNSTPVPTAETGATIYYGDTSGRFTGYAFAQMAVAVTRDSAATERAALGNESVRIHNSSSDHIRLTDGTNVFSIAINSGVPELRIVRLSGSGGLHLSSAVKVAGALTLNNHATLAAGKDLLGSTTSDLGATGTRLQKLWIQNIDFSGALTAGGHITLATGKDLLGSTTSDLGATGTRLQKLWIADINFSNALTAGGHITLGAGIDLLGTTTSDLGSSGTRLQKLWIGAIDVSGALTAGGHITLAAGKDLLGSATTDLGATGTRLQKLWIQNIDASAAVTFGSTLAADGHITLAAGIDLLGSTTSDLGATGARLQTLWIAAVNASSSIRTGSSLQVTSGNLSNGLSSDTLLAATFTSTAGANAQAYDGLAVVNTVSAYGSGNFVSLFFGITNDVSGSAAGRLVMQYTADFDTDFHIYLRSSASSNNQVKALTLSHTGDLTLRQTSSILSVDGTTDSSSTTTGSVHTDGGLGVVKEFFLGGDMHMAAGKDLLGSVTSDIGATGTRFQKLWIDAIDVSGILTHSGSIGLGVGDNLLLNGAGDPTNLAGGLGMLNGTAATGTIAGISAWAADQADGGAQLAEGEFVVMNEGLTKYHIGGGASADEDVRVGGSLSDAADFTTSTKAGATGVLKSFTIPANLLGVNGKALRVTAWGTKSGTGGVATVRIRIGSTPTQILAMTLDNTSGRGWFAELYIVRLSTSTLNVFMNAREQTQGTAFDMSAQQSYGVVDHQAVSSDIDLTSAQTIDFDVSAIDGADTVTQEGLIIELLN